MLGGVTLLPHPLVRRTFASPVPPGTGWPDDPATPTTPVARAADDVRRLAAIDDLAELDARVSCLLGLPAAGRVARGGRASEKRASFADQPYWGRPIAGLGRPGAVGAHRRSRAGGQRRQPHRPGVHRRLVGRLAVRVAAPGRAGRPADERARRRRPAAASAPGWSRPCGARRRSTSRPPRSGTPASRGSARRSGWSSRWLRVVVALGGFGWAGALDALAAAGYVVPRPRPKFGHGASVELAGPATAPCCCSAATTPASRTPSPAGSPPPCSTTSSAAPRRSAVTSYDLVARATTTHDVLWPPYPNR